MIGFLFALLIMIVVARLFSIRNDVRIRANRNMMLAIEEMHECLETLLDAKAKFDGDVPDEVMDLARWMVQNADEPRMEYALLALLSDEHKHSEKRPPKISDKLREPLDRVFSELVHAWFSYVANKNIFVRFLIRAMLGRMMEKDEGYSPYNAVVVKQVAVKRDPCFSAATA